MMWNTAFRDSAGPGSVSKRLGLVLAGGDGIRLRPLTRFISGDDRLKQFCALFGGASLLMHTRRRAEPSIPAQRVLYSLTSGHERFYLPDLADCPSLLVVQPSNRGTAPGILASLPRIVEVDDDAVVAILPSDHQFSNEDLLAESLQSAFQFAEQQPNSILMLGAQPNKPETEYGWIEPGGALRGQDANLFHVRRFHEKPSFHLAQQFLERNSLWNTFVMVGTVRAFLGAVCSAAPELLDVFQSSPPLARRDGTTWWRQHSGISPRRISIARATLVIKSSEGSTRKRRGCFSHAYAIRSSSADALPPFRCAGDFGGCNLRRLRAFGGGLPHHSARVALQVWCQPSPTDRLPRPVRHAINCPSVTKRDRRLVAFRSRLKLELYMENRR